MSYSVPLNGPNHFEEWRFFEGPSYEGVELGRFVLELGGWRFIEGTYEDIAAIQRDVAKKRIEARRARRRRRELGA